MSDIADALSAGWDEQVKETTVEPQAPAPVAAKEETAPAPHTPAPAGDRARDEQGRFAKSETKPAEVASAPVSPTPAAQPGGGGQPVAGGATSLSPPPGWSIAAKAEFDKLPPAVQEAVAKREADVNAGFERYQGLSPYVDMARQAGQTLPDVLNRYITAENILQQDFGNGILSLCEFYQVEPARLGQFLLGEGSDGQPTGQSDQFAPVLNRLNQVDQRLQTWEKQQNEALNASVRDELQRFAADSKHKFFENVRQTMGQLIAANPETSLNDAYEQACWMNPEIRQLLLKQQQDEESAKARATADQARRAAASLPTGAPIPGVNSGSAPKNSLRAQIESDWDGLAGNI
jgi:hypothetical protein